MNKIPRVQKGSSHDFCFALDDEEDVAGWVCTIVAKQFPGDPAAVSRVITATGNKWEGFLTSAETATMALGLWFLTALQVNATTGETQTKQSRYGISKAWTP